MRKYRKELHIEHFMPNRLFDLKINKKKNVKCDLEIFQSIKKICRLIIRFVATHQFSMQYT